MLADGGVLWHRVCYERHGGMTLDASTLSRARAHAEDLERELRHTQNKLAAAAVDLARTSGELATMRITVTSLTSARDAFRADAERLERELATARAASLAITRDRSLADAVRSVAATVSAMSAPAMSPPPPPVDPPAPTEDRPDNAVRFSLLELD